MWLVTDRPAMTPGGGGGTLKVSYIRRLGSFLGGSIDIWGGGGGSEKYFFRGLNILRIFFGVITKLGYIEG